TQRAYQREFDVQNIPKRNTTLGLTKKFEINESLVREKGKHRSSRLPTVFVDVTAQVEQSPKKSLRPLSQETGYIHSMYQTGLKTYRVTVAQQLQETDKDKHCCWFQVFIVQNLAKLSITRFTDEVWFHLFNYGHYFTTLPSTLMFTLIR
ncbi:hypothetical protein C0J52_12169, partial [Blattella germanica]